MFNFVAYIKLKYSILILSVFSVFSYSAVSDVSELSFGTIAVLNNDVVSEISISTTNQINITNSIRVLSPGQRGEYFLSSFPAHTQLFTAANIIITTTYSVAPASEQFTLSALFIEPSVTTDALGTATIYIGGTLQTSGTGSGQYYDTLYDIDFELTINY